MANCRACGGILGRDCFNEADCLEISRSCSYNNDEYVIQLEQHISILIYTMEQKGINIPNWFSVDPPLVLSVPHSCETDPTEYCYLPF